MLNQTYLDMLQEKDLIFEIFGYSVKRAAQVGPDNVYDFSLGNPSLPPPDSVTRAFHRILDETDPVTLHGYSPSPGIPAVREQIAADLNRRFRPESLLASSVPGDASDLPAAGPPYPCSRPYSAGSIFMASGAAGAIAHALRAVCSPGDEILAIAPCFSEYKPYTAGAGLTLKVVPADTDHFQIDFDRLQEMLGPRVSAVLINSPCNPSGIVYSTETIRTLAAIMTRKAQAFGHPIFLISDEPYRDIIFKDVDNPYIANYYPDTLTCYSFSKSISLPGERIGYLAVNPDSAYAADIMAVCPQISRTIGHNSTAALLQRTAACVCNQTSDLAVYETNMNLLYEGLTSYGFECVKPGGTFYMFPRSLEPDDLAFCRRAMMELDLMLVPGSIFGCPGHFRIAYCVPTERIHKALPVFKKLADMYR
ncbi:MAG: pyridoxal phosphate-dependent aminotransferase [Lachnospiraceae bacterium]